MSSLDAVLKTGLVLLIASGAAAKDAETLKEALTKGSASVALRYRYELVSDDAFDKDAHASTLRTALGFRTLPFKGGSVFIQAQNVSPIFGDGTFNNRGAAALANGITDHPVVVDPSQTRMQQAYFRFEGFDSSFHLGRREIFYGDHRFIGTVAWRQNHQAFNAIYLVNQSLAKTKLSYTFADKVIRIFGDEQEMSSHFLNGVVDVTDATSLELFGYLLDYQEKTTSGSSSQTYGFRLLGAEPVGERAKILFELEFAKQRDFADNPSELDASYWEVVSGIGWGGRVNVRVGRELLGAADGALAFQTPLATGHKFNGWADKFLRTPAGGLVDRYVSVDGTFRTFVWLIAYHNFVADEGDASYGSELNAQLSYRSPWAQVFATKLALYREDGFSSDTSKLWIWTQYSF